MVKKQILFLGILLLTGCISQKIEPSSRLVKNTIQLEQASAASSAEPEFLISENGIGQAVLGMTLGELKQICDQDTKFELVSSFSSDTNAIAVVKNGLVQYYIPYVAGTTNHPDKSTPTDSDRITLLVTDNYNFQTRDGIKVGTPIQEAEEVYGDAILAYNVEGKSKEYITFDDNNLDNVRFRASYFKLISDGLGFSGIYPEYPGVSTTTDKYQSDAAIAAIEVSCDQNDCPN